MLDILERMSHAKGYDLMRVAHPSLLYEVVGELHDVTISYYLQPYFDMVIYYTM